MRRLALLLLFAAFPASAQDTSGLAAALQNGQPMQIVFYKDGTFSKTVQLSVVEYDNASGAFALGGMCSVLKGILRPDRLVMSGCNCDVDLRPSGDRALKGTADCGLSGPGNEAELLY